MDITASSVGSGILQAAAAAEQRPECLLKRTEAISSSRLYSNTHTAEKYRKKHLREDKKTRNHSEQINPSDIKPQSHTLRGSKAQII